MNRHEIKGGGWVAWIPHSGSLLAAGGGDIRCHVSICSYRKNAPTPLLSSAYLFISIGCERLALVAKES